MSAPTKEVVFFGGFTTKAEALAFGETLTTPWCVMTILKGFYDKDKDYEEDHAFDVMTFIVVNENTVSTLQTALAKEE